MELKLLINDHQQKDDDIITDAESLLSFGQLAAEAFQYARFQEKRLLLNSFGSNLSIKNRKLEIQFEKPISIIKDISSSVKGKRVKKDRLEPVQVVKKKKTYSNKTAISPEMLRKINSIRTFFLEHKGPFTYQYCIKMLAGK